MNFLFWSIISALRKSFRNKTLIPNIIQYHKGNNFAQSRASFFSDEKKNFYRER